MKPLNLEETRLKKEMKSRCLNKGQYIDENAKAKFNMLCHLEDFEIQYWNLEQENQELNQKYLNAVADYEQEKFNVEELKKQNEEYKRLGFKHLNDKCNELENQQKEFIEWLENEITQYGGYTLILYKEILLKFKEIIGVLNENSKD